MGVLMLCLSLTAQAEVFRCVSPEGKATYSDKPCPLTDAQKSARKPDMSKPSPIEPVDAPPAPKAERIILPGRSDGRDPAPAPVMPQARTHALPGSGNSWPPGAKDDAIAACRLLVERQQAREKLVADDKLDALLELCDCSFNRIERQMSYEQFAANRSPAIQQAVTECAKTRR